jgi:AmiR/NasT family two-component response regulator
MTDSVRVLVVDDSEPFRRSTCRILHVLGYEVIGEAEDGRQAVEKTLQLRPDLVLMDVEMPELSGIEAACEIQKAHPTPIVLLTAHDSLELIRGARDAGVAAYLVKPLNAQEMQRIVTISMARFEDWVALRIANEELAQRNAQLQKALRAIKTLRGLLPVCAWCGRKIQNEDGEWVSLESYIESHSEAEFTHGICSECLQKLRPSAERV